MKNIYLLLIVLALSNTACGQTETDTIFVAHWNVENLFDTSDDPKTEDEEFLPASEKEWIDERLDTNIFVNIRPVNSITAG